MTGFSLLRWINAFALDTASIVAVWVLWFSRNLDASIPVAIPACAIALGYWADRWCDVHAKYSQRETFRHQIFRKYRRCIALLWVVCFAALIVYAISELPLAVYTAGLPLAWAAAGYVALAQMSWVRRHLKELLSAVLFATACVIFPFLYADAGHKAALTGNGIALAAAAWLNQLIFHRWESRSGAARDAPNPRAPTPLRAATIALIATCLLFADAVTGLLLLLPAAGWFGMDRLERPKNLDLRRILSDALLLGPLGVMAAAEVCS